MTDGPAAGTVYVVIGQTASGKTNFALQLAHELSCSVLSCDAFQVYRGFDVASDKITPDEMMGIEHFGISIAEPDAEFTVKAFLEYAVPIVSDRITDGHDMVVVGGTHMYVEKLLFTSALDDAKPEDDASTAPGTLDPSGCTHDILREVDPVMADKLHPNDLRRIQKALECFYTTGVRMSDKLQAQTRELRWPKIVVFCKEVDGENSLESKIRARIESKMLKDDKLRQELYRLKKMIALGQLEWGHGILQAIGYREFRPYIDSLIQGVDDAGLFEAGVTELTRNTVRYTKKQRTWIRKLDTLLPITHVGEFSKDFLTFLKVVP